MSFFLFPFLLFFLLSSRQAEGRHRGDRFYLSFSSLLCCHKPQAQIQAVNITDYNPTKLQSSLSLAQSTLIKLGALCYTVRAQWRWIQLTFYPFQSVLFSRRKPESTHQFQSIKSNLTQVLVAGTPKRGDHNKSIYIEQSTLHYKKNTTRKTCSEYVRNAGKKNTRHKEREICRKKDIEDRAVLAIHCENVLTYPGNEQSRGKEREIRKGGNIVQSCRAV